MNAMMTHSYAASQGLLPETVRVLLVEDNPLDVEAIQALLRLCPRTKFKVDSVDSTEACLEALKGHSFDLILLDHNLPGVDSLSFLNSFNHNGALPPVIILTEQASSQGLARSIHRALEKFWLNEQVEDSAGTRTAIP